MKYWTCQNCGANLDFCEKCDCSISDDENDTRQEALLSLPKTKCIDAFFDKQTDNEN